MKAPTSIERVPLEDLIPYLGKPRRAGSDTLDTAGHLPAKGGSLPTPALHSQGSEQ